MGLCIRWCSHGSGESRSRVMNRVRLQFVALLGAATLAASALGQTGDHVACYKVKDRAKRGAFTVTVTNERSLNLEVFQDVEDSVFELYSAVRNGYLQRRHRSIEEAIEAHHAEWHPSPMEWMAAR